MGISICTIGGYDEVGKNCTAIKVDDEVVILDMGLHLDKYIAYTEDEDVYDFSAKKLMEIGAVPDLSHIKEWIPFTKAILCTHAHLDHIGAVPFLSNKFDCPVITTPFAKAVLEAILKDERIDLRNDIKSVNPNSVYKISDKITAEFINMTHSTPQTAMIAIHTEYGTIVYANDFKFDQQPVLGKKPNLKRLSEIGKKGVLCLILDSIYADSPRKTPSEGVAKEMLKDVMLGTNSKGKAVVITTFSSHLARLKSIIEFGKKLNRKVIFLGRSLNKYVKAGEDVNIVDFSKKAKIIGFKDKIRKELNRIADKKDKYIIVCTGHQGEPKAVLPRIVNNEYKFRLGPGDHVIFSCTVIPNEINHANREILESKLRKNGVRIFRDIHVSGHCSREDQRDLIEMLNPKNIIPAHVDAEKAVAMAELTKELGYKLGKSVFIMDDGGELTF
ncbi:RNase J family beta-CASP ribonuclease [Candidatus Woesearchaeota archaeon]|nr:RNase J family beta-CASP ribonuclease [Candidatus Woesearchaeota archaeon]